MAVFQSSGSGAFKDMDMSSGRWKKGTVLGAGSFGTVYLASPVDSSSAASSTVAVKSTGDMLSAYELQMEAVLLQELQDCPYVIQGFGTDISMEDGKKIFNLLMEYAPGGSFEKIIQNYNGYMIESLVASYTFMLLKGMESIHGKDIVHCDIKPQNILVFPQPSGISILKIADFGLSEVMVREEAEEPAAKKVKVETGDCKELAVHGTALYSPPESVIYGLNSKAGDIWAIGCVVVEMITGRPLWRYTFREELFHQIQHKCPSIPETISEECKDFLRRCLDRDHTRRWTAGMLLSHPFILKYVNSSSINGTHMGQRSTSKQWICREGMFSTTPILKKVQPKKNPARGTSSRPQGRTMRTITIIR